ncbi:K+-transporting ATPase ATPase C chain [Hymenobacter gelipurpurascens]|uniref:Potassium-transporting ATPase KdpC subunit n=1 Tax=Hymenobacter gelipurpurascens TaxID=89968 RepID=A0A212UHN3_9BACT|nr:potassium-transporting ATPase subunit KdpC [Hymenobacter gelipurpurascens]SNC77574.1 K+-transporting ATPase ATPase C chain [Hymenobacter gelipurpurascens]
MKNNLLPAFRLTLVLLVLCAGVYPALIWAGAQLAPGAGQGVTLRQNGRVVGFANVGQKFDQPQYFNGRPSAVDYNAASSAGSNKGPTNPEYLALVQQRLDTLLQQNPGVTKNQVSAELITASGSGLDPDLSPEAAAVQVARIAKARHLDAATVQALVTQHTVTGLLAPARVNVLQLNLAMDALAPTRR